MSDGFDVEYDTLEEVGDSLAGLASEFDGMEDMMEGHAEAAGRPPLEEIGFGGDTLADKLDRVGSNWSDERGEIVDTMEAAADYARQAAGAYRDLDTGIAGEFTG